MYAAAGGASLASRQARQRQRQQKRNQQLQAKLHPPKPSASSITEQSAITPTRSQSRQFHQLPTNYLRTSQTQARKLSATYTTQSKLLLPIDEGDNHSHCHSHLIQSHQYPLYQSPYLQLHSHGVSSRKLVHRHSGSSSTNIYQLKLSKSATATLPLVSQMEATPPTTPSGVPEGQFDTAPNMDASPSGHTTIHIYNHDAIIVTPATPMASPGHVGNSLHKHPEVLTDMVGKTEDFSLSAVIYDEDQIKHQAVIQQDRKCSVYRMRRNEELQDMDSGSSSVKKKLRDLQLNQKQVQYEPLLSNESHLCYKGIPNRRKWQLCAYCEEGLCICEHIEGQIYAGMAQSGERERNVGERIVKDLCINLFDGSGSNIVCDNFFTSYNLAKSLMIDNNLSILGTCNKRRTFVAAAFANPKGREAESSMFGFYNHVTMCSYVPKKNKAVVLLSTSHYTTETSGPKKKPLLILDYNKTKGGVDSMDMCLSEYSTKRRTNRWPLAFFYNIVDFAAFAAYIIYVDNNTHLKSYTSRRRMFLHQLSDQLCKPEIERRANNSRISRVFSTRNAIEAMIGRPIRVVDAGAHEAEERDSTGRLKVKGNCYICSKRRPTRKACTLCNIPVCAEHSKDLPQCDRCN